MFVFVRNDLKKLSLHVSLYIEKFVGGANGQMGNSTAKFLCSRAHPAIMQFYYLTDLCFSAIGNTAPMKILFTLIGMIIWK